MPVEASTNGSRGLSLQLVLHPGDGDQVVSAPGGAQVLIDPLIVSMLDDKTLDAAVDAHGNTALVLIGPDL